MGERCGYDAAAGLCCPQLLTVIQKVEVFEHALDSTTGEDLHKVCVSLLSICGCQIGTQCPSLNAQ
jgi:hypothetical protein